MYRVKEIIEPDFGCEGLPDGQEPMCDVVLEKDNGEKETVRIADRELYAKEVTEGCLVDYTNGCIVKL